MGFGVNSTWPNYAYLLDERYQHEFCHVPVEIALSFIQLETLPFECGFNGNGHVEG